MALSFLESVKDQTPTVGGFNLGNATNTFDDLFKEACEAMRNEGIDPLMDINMIVRNKNIAQTWSDKITAGIVEECAKYNDPMEYGSLVTLPEQVQMLCGNVTDQLVKESTTVGQLMPIKAIDYPILIKQHLALATKDVMQTEVTKSPVIKKQIERRWIVDNQTGKRWEYPQCFFDQATAEEIFSVGKGLPIKNTPVELPVFDYDLIANCTDSATPGREKLTINTKIVKGILEDGTEIPLDIHVDLHLNVWAPAVVDTTVVNKSGETIAVKDNIGGNVDFINNKVTVSSASGQIKKVVFAGYLSNELNERSVGMDYTRMEREWKIEDGHRVDVPYSVEELEDAKALLDMDLYKKTYDNLASYLTDMEDSQIIKFLDDEFVKYSGVELDPLGWNSFVREINFDCDSTIQTTALPSEFIEKQLKFWIDRFLIDLTETAKMED